MHTPGKEFEIMELSFSWYVIDITLIRTELLPIDRQALEGSELLPIDRQALEGSDAMRP